MTSKNLAFVICRLFALYALSQVLVYFVYILNGSYLPPAFSVGEYSTFAAVPLAAIIVALFFWFKAEWLAGKIVDRYSDQKTSAGIRAKDIQTAGFAIVGMYLLAESFPVIASDIGRVLFVNDLNDPGGAGTHHSSMIPHYIRVVGELIIGFLLIFKASFFAQKN